MERTKMEAEEAGRRLIERLRRLDRNRSRVVGDKPTPRKRGAAANPTPSSTDQLLELQSIRRGILGLVEVGKLVSGPAHRLRGAC